MENTIAIVTGANRGIGKETAIALAERKYTVVMACRNVEQAQIAANKIRSVSGNPNVFAFELDLSSFDSIKGFSKAFSENFGKLNILINNAGITTQDYAITPDGFEKTIETNSIGPYLLTKILLPLFPDGEDNRIINLSSDIYKMGIFTLAKLNTYHWVKAYAVSKYAQLLITFKLADVLKERGITVNAVHPGIVRTNIMLTRKWYDSIINLILAPLYIDAKKGAEPTVHLAVSGDLKGVTGKYFKRLTDTKVKTKYLDKDLMNNLYDFYELICGNPDLE
jgi:NAD(P)-dependent dehydrogenase (short-subunit alcohol dehydrogenase family)